MKRNEANNFLAQLSRIGECLEVLCDEESKSAYLASLDNVISRLQIIRDRLSELKTTQPLSQAESSIKHLVDFLQNSKDDESLMALLAGALGAGNSRQKRVAIEIPTKLSNDEIRRFLEQDLSKEELKAIAVQRGISVGKRSETALREDILENLRRQEGYQRLAAQ